MLQFRKVRWHGRVATAHRAHSHDDDAIRGEIFSADRLEHHAQEFASGQVVVEDEGWGYDLAAAARKNGSILFDCHAAIAQAARERRAITPAAEWLLDNFHVIDAQLKSIYDECTPRLSRALPKLMDGPMRGHPRVYALVQNFIAHTDSRLDSELLRRFMHGYQRGMPLTIRELWSVPVVLRCVMIENLRRLAVRVVRSQNGRRDADALADEWDSVNDSSAGPPSHEPNDILRRVSDPTRPRAFALQLAQRLRGRERELASTLRALDDALDERGLTRERLIQLEQASQSAANLTVRNLITSMRDMAAFDWQAFVEEVSLIDALIRESPAFGRMDFLTRDRYRHAIEDLADRSPRSELEIARLLIRETQSIGDSDGDPDSGVHPARDPGYFLIAAGRPEFERKVGYRVSLRSRFLRGLVSRAEPAYFGGIAVVAGLLVLLAAQWSSQAGVSMPGLIALVLFAILPASEIAVTAVNRVVVRLLPPRHLPRLELTDGIPPSMRTMVVVPILLTDEAAISESVQRLEIHFLANADGDLRFALLSDWVDADAASMPGDDALIRVTMEGINELNRRHGSAADGGPRFFVFHRRRQWSETQQKWIGWERKRGKLHELNRLLRGAGDTSFVSIGGIPPRPPSGVRYVLTLDSDTRLPIASVRQLVGNAAHPLNWPRLCEHEGRVTEGYSILQPRITPRFPARKETSVFQRLFSAPSGLDAYAAAASDVYQDLFGEGSYTGKGLYDVDAFEASLEGRIPENSVLSHDLFESIFARCALVGDVELFEDFPSHSEVAASRAHRWTRGDWQLLSWTFASAGRGIPVLGKWKLFDNLRRSLVAPSVLAMLVASWSIPNASWKVWGGLAALAFSLPAFLSVLDGLIPPRPGSSLRHHFRAVGKDIGSAFTHLLVSLTFLPQHTWMALDAIVRTLWRLFVTRKRLLEWTTAAQVRGSTGLSLGDFLWPLQSAGVVAFAATASVLFGNPHALLFAGPVILLWWGSPLIARAVSLPPEDSRKKPIEVKDAIRLRMIARRTWRYFATFVTAEDHWLPPDNFQEEPRPIVAHRSSPTNFGLYLLSTAAARDFGWLSVSETVERWEATLRGLYALPRHRGHFFNWYDTRTLRALPPEYISSVDSGNLAGHLLALEEACLAMIDRPVYDASSLLGLLDATRILRDAVAASRDDRRTLTVDRTLLNRSLDDVESLLSGVPFTVAEWDARWRDLASASETLLDVARTFADERGEPDDGDIRAWAESLHSGIAFQRKEMRLLPSVTGKDSSESASSPLSTLRGNSAEWARLLENARKRPVPGNEVGTSRGGRGASDVAVLEIRAKESGALVERLKGVAAQTRRLFDDMNFRFLFDERRKLFSVGYRVADGTLDDSHYDLLASEARLASFIAIAKGEIPVVHWFRLGRPMAALLNGEALLSWSGSMFEYLMPSLVLRTPANSLMDLTCRHVVGRQIEYGNERGVPWGVSESAFNQRDRELTYQYSPFGVPGLGFKRGLGQNLVVAPYATALASLFDVPSATANFEELRKLGAQGAYGFYEALDFTPARLREKDRFAIVRAYFAHHQGMALVALANVLHDGAFRRRFHRHPMIQAAELLLEERPPREIVPARIPTREAHPAVVLELAPLPARHFTSLNLPTPATHLLSNGRYSVMVTSAGSGFSTWENLAINRWREDPTTDAWGSFVFVRDAGNGRVWSAGYQPSGAEPDHYEATFTEDRAQMRRTDGAISTALEIIVSPEDDAEIRRISLSNHGLRARQLEITSYMEVVLAPAAADRAHPAFSNLFVQTEYAPEVRGVLAWRRPRAASDAIPWAAHVLATSEQLQGAIEYETDRARFLGRGHTVHSPVSIMDGRPLSNTVGPVLDPIFSLRARLRLEPGATVHLAFTTLVAPTRERVLALADKYHDPSAFERISSLAWTHAQVQRHHLGTAADEENLFQSLADSLLYFDPSLRMSRQTLGREAGSVRELWRLGLSGDLPIALLRIDDVEDREIVRQLVRAHQWWRSKRFAVDLVFLNEGGASYSQDLQEVLENAVRASRPAPNETARQGGLFVLNAAQISPEELDVLGRAARVILESESGSLAEQVLRARRLRGGPKTPSPVASPSNAAAMPLSVPKLSFFNGLGGFTEDGREYVTVLRDRRCTPAPWINVIANSKFGFLISESGSGWVWCLNSRENQITPWSNDPVGDAPGEAIYLRDEETGQVWSPTALPIRIENGTYIARHGQGFSRFEHSSHGIRSSLVQFVADSDPVKFAVLELENVSTQPRRLSVTHYVEWVLGSSRSAAAPFIVTEIDSATGAMFARNPWNAEFGERVAFLDIAGVQTEWTGDRREFIGRNGSREHPRALLRDGPLSGSVGGDLDPCGALKTMIQLKPGRRVRLVFTLGQGENRADARRLVEKCRRLDPERELADVVLRWDRDLESIQVKTPEPALDFMLNRWLLYQTLTCRMWGRAGFYQAGGAYGFRDQLQDCLALTVARPDVVREHLLRAAGRQFVEGDVQHWWHPPSGRGVRTHCSDDRLWLPFAVAHYVEVTGDTGVLDEQIPFLEGPELPLDREDAYFEPVRSSQGGTLFEHCVRAIERSFGTGSHGLPLIGSGDWNDGFNRVGHAGKGESVWLGWFLITTLERFSPIAETRGDVRRAEVWRRHVAELRAAIERDAWDGAWYRRAYFDDGTPLGSVSGTECRIDSLSQSWSVLSGAADPGRARVAMQSVEENLVLPGDDIALLFTPPFDKSPLDPGYIKGYLPGVRENGGQYTHAAVWCAIAYAMLGEGDAAAELLRMLNPIHHAASRAGVHAYKVEPYVVAADVYSVAPHTRRGGWTWYTGAAGWMYRAGVEWILGIRKKGAELSIDPCIPKDWPGFEARFRHGSTSYDIRVENPAGVMRGVVRIELDGVPVEASGRAIPLADDGQTHDVRVVLG